MKFNTILRCEWPKKNLWGSAEERTTLLSESLVPMDRNYGAFRWRFFALASRMPALHLPWSTSPFRTRARGGLYHHFRPCAPPLQFRSCSASATDSICAGGTTTRLHVWESRAPYDMWGPACKLEPAHSLAALRSVCCRCACSPSCLCSNFSLESDFGNALPPRLVNLQATATTQMIQPCLLQLAAKGDTIGHRLSSLLACAIKQIQRSSACRTCPQHVRSV